jgi:hypothetical protein
VVAAEDAADTAQRHPNLQNSIQVVPDHFSTALQLLSDGQNAADNIFGDRPGVMVRS